MTVKKELTAKQKRAQSEGEGNTESKIILTVRMPPDLMSWMNSAKDEEGDGSVTETFQRCANGVWKYFDVPVDLRVELEKERAMLNAALRPQKEHLSKIKYLQLVLIRYARALEEQNRRGGDSSMVDLITRTGRDISDVAPKRPRLPGKKEG